MSEYYTIELDVTGAAILADGVKIIAEEWVEVAASKPWPELAQLVKRANAECNFREVVGKFIEDFAAAVEEAEIATARYNALTKAIEKHDPEWLAAWRDGGQP